MRSPFFSLFYDLLPAFFRLYPFSFSLFSLLRRIARPFFAFFLLYLLGFRVSALFSRTTKISSLFQTVIVTRSPFIFPHSSPQAFPPAAACSPCPSSPQMRESHFSLVSPSSLVLGGRRTTVLVFLSRLLACFPGPFFRSWAAVRSSSGRGCLSFFLVSS